jgi:acetylornithine deacetylase
MMISEKERKVIDLIAENSGEIAGFLRKLINFKTVAPPIGGKADDDEYIQHQKFINETLREMNFDTDIWEINPSELESYPGSGVMPDRDLSKMPVVVGTLKGEGNGRSLILNGHCDVVPLGVIDNWTHDPFKGEIEDNKIFGRGACDMKAGIAAMLHAVKFIQKSGIKLGGDIIVQVVPEEELTQMGTLACCQKGYRADAAIIPEPSGMNIWIAMRGSIHGKITVFGRAGHAAQTQSHWMAGGGVNAISKAAKIIVAMEELTEEWRNRPDKQHKLVDPDNIVPTVISGGEYWEMYPEKVEIEFSSNFIPGSADTIAEIREKIMSVANTDPWLKEHPPKIEISWVYGAEIDENEPIVETAIASVNELGFKTEIEGLGTLTDAIHLINYSNIPTISIGPATLENAHAPDEYMEIEQLINATKVLALIIMRWCGCS